MSTTSAFSGDQAEALTLQRDDSAADATPYIQLIGGEYRASPTTYSDGDASVLQVDANGYLKVNAAATAAGLALESGGNLDTIAGDTTSLDTKAGTTGAAAAVDGTRAAQLRYIGGKAEDNRALLATIDADTSTIAGDTTSLDTKTPSLGTATMTGASPITIATDDTMTAAANALLGTIDADTGAIKTATELLDNIVQSDDSNPGATPAIALVGGEYRSSDSTYTDGDATILQTDIAGKVKIAGYDTTNDLNKVQEQSPQWSRYTDAVALIGAAQDFTGSWADLGSEIDCRGYRTLRVFLNLDINAGANLRVRVLGKHTSAHANEYNYDPNKWALVSSTLVWDATNGISYRELDSDIDSHPPYNRLPVCARCCNICVIRH